MLLPYVEREVMTIYNKRGDSMKKTIIPNSIWKSNIEMSFNSNGNIPMDSLKIYIEDYDGYKSSYTYDGFDGWTIDVGRGNNATYIVRGYCDYDFTSSNGRDLEREIDKFEKIYDCRRPIALKENFYGSKIIRHLMIIC